MPALLDELQERINELEIKSSFQEQLIADLNDALTAESQRLGVLERQVTQLRQRQEAEQSPTAEGNADEPPPPHY
ncbi:MAG: SlyX family protein [Pseudomonadales bacterium]